VPKWSERTKNALVSGEIQYRSSTEMKNK
jgi:hypothetical protein